MEEIDLLEQIKPQDAAVEVSPRDAERVLFVFLGVVEWYLTVYLPERQGEAPEPLPALPPPPNPYRGLLAFREQDAANWFGREPDAADLPAAVQRQPLVAVVGPSGSGKSSLVYAGVVPRLRATDGMRIADFRPRGRPFAELAQALIALWQTDDVDRLAQSRKLAAHLAEAQVTLTDAVRETLRQTGGSRLVLIADQFEELYTLGQPGGETQGFTDLLVQAVQDSLAIPNRAGPPDLCLLLTLRADFLGHALAHPGLTALLDRCPPKLLGPVADRARLRAIIEQPARGAGVTLEDLLPERILRDLAQLPGTAEQVGGASLPLLEFALSQLWDQQQERRLTHRGYEQLGGLQQALSRHADGVLARLDPADQARMRHVLVQMVRPGEGTEDTRQVATRDQLSPDDWPLVVRLADADTRLVVTGHDQTTDQDTAELVHEALIRYWSPLREWINADRAFRLWQNGLRQAMGEWTMDKWERTGRDPGALLAGARLVEAEERLGLERERLADQEIAYIKASLARQAAEQAERQRQHRERERLQRRISFGLAAFLVVALALTALAGWQWRVADERGAQTLEQLHEANHNLGLALNEKSIQAADRLVWVNSVAFSPDGRTLASASEDKTIRLWSLDDLPTLLKPLTPAQLAAEEARFGLHLEGLELVPLSPEPNLYGVPTQPVVWSPNHPNHWLPAAEAGDTSAMVHIGLIYDRAGDNKRALTWYRKAAAAGDSDGAARLAFLEDWLKRQEASTPP